MPKGHIFRLRSRGVIHLHGSVANPGYLLLCPVGGYTSFKTITIAGGCFAPYQIIPSLVEYPWVSL